MKAFMPIYYMNNIQIRMETFIQDYPDIFLNQELLILIDFIMNLCHNLLMPLPIPFGLGIWLMVPKDKYQCHI